ncbi:PF08922 domain protein [Leptospira weilii serovar Ranarum str. ICFT]|uniref:PF08922 domain protein n=1 Tax=Leptospira weilii serovar Ranarum str. ICFT TaxID=1218598 RepID=N1WB10_9LEPT|nr:PF08922 domain protein [Leptospira weilii serovar Ranarum str. ICFT]
MNKTSRSWGMIPVTAKIGVTSWNTSIFPEKNSTKYVLPLKADVRKKEKITVNQKVHASITIQF